MLFISRLKLVTLAVLLIVSLSSCSQEPTLTEPEHTISLPKTETSVLYGEVVSDVQSALAKEDEAFAQELKNWQEVNEDTCALVKIPELEIYEPVVAATVDNLQWLRTNIYGDYSVDGTAFLDVQCDIQSSPVKLIHGHNMKNGTMFGHLPEYLNIDSCEHAPDILLYTKDGLLKYSVFAVLSVNSKEEALPLDLLATGEDVNAMAEEFLDRSWVPGGEIISDDLLVLNTCWYGKSGTERNLHCLVVASRA